MLNRLKILLLISTLFFIGCSTMIHKKTTQLPTHKKYAISSFWNYTETPMAGLRASSIVESVLAKEPIEIISLVSGDEKASLSQNKNEFLTQNKTLAKSKGAAYLITGEVQEWQYKTGIDGEPVVSYTIKIIDLSNNKTLFNAVGAKSGWGHKSIGIVAQEVAQEIIPKFSN